MLARVSRTAQIALLSIRIHTRISTRHKQKETPRPPSPPPFLCPKRVTAKGRDNPPPLPAAATMTQTRTKQTCSGILNLWLGHIYYRAAIPTPHPAYTMTRHNTETQLTKKKKTKSNKQRPIKCRPFLRVRPRRGVAGVAKKKATRKQKKKKNRTRTEITRNKTRQLRRL